jgi:hypothetical protein
MMSLLLEFGHAPNCDRREENVLTAVAAVSEMLWNSGNDDAYQLSRERFFIAACG